MTASLAAQDFDALFRAVPCALLVLAADAPRFTIAAVSDAYLAATLTTRDIIGAPLFQVFPDNPNDRGATGVSNLTASLLRVIENGAPDAMPLQRYDIPDRSVVRGFQERHWIPQNAPFRANSGAISHVIHRVEDVTAVVRVGQAAAHGAPPVARRYLVPLGSNVDLPRLREVVRQACAACELDELSVMDLLVAASELGRNIVGNGGSGVVEVSELGFDLPRGIQLSFHEPGCSTMGLHQAVSGGSVKDALGVYGPRQLVDQFEVGVEPDGATVTVTKWKRGAPQRELVAPATQCLEKRLAS